MVKYNQTIHQAISFGHQSHLDQPNKLPDIELLGYRNIQTGLLPNYWVTFYSPKMHQLPPNYQTK